VNLREPPPIPAALLALNLRMLVGVPEDRAREIVAASGGELRVVRDGIMTADHNSRRISVTVRDGRILEVLDGLS